MGFRLHLFRLLEWLSHLRRPPATPKVVGASSGGPCLWVYVTTIGELNAIEAWLSELLQRMGQPQLVLLTNHAHYADAYLRKFSTAVVVSFDGAAVEARRLFKRFPPALLVVAEIPCIPHDAPCRFSFATLLAAKEYGAPIVLVNGWLYGDGPGCRMDAIERAWFSADYVRAFDLMLVQTESVREALLALGASPEKVIATGNLKYDALRTAARRHPIGALYDALSAYRDGPMIVAGSVTETEDQRQMLQAFAGVFARYPGARLVLAPRHPENRPRMEALAELLRASGLDHAYRSHIEPGQAAAKPVLILDTMGELGGCYAAATFAYVGTDHNVLEPLAFGRLVFVSGNWLPVYPSYPVYRQTLEAGLIVQVDGIAELGGVWLATMDDLKKREAEQRLRVEALLTGDQGRVATMLDLLSRHVAQGSLLAT